MEKNLIHTQNYKQVFFFYAKYLSVKYYNILLFSKNRNFIQNNLQIHANDKNVKITKDGNGKKCNERRLFVKSLY